MPRGAGLAEHQQQRRPHGEAPRCEPAAVDTPERHDYGDLMMVTVMIVCGALAGLAIGALTGHVGVWLGLGIPLGTAAGAWLNARRHRRLGWG